MISCPVTTIVQAWFGLRQLDDACGASACPRTRTSMCWPLSVRRRWSPASWSVSGYRVSGHYAV